MTITGHHVEALRALLADVPLPPGIGDDDFSALGILLTTALLIASRSEFAKGWSKAEIIRFVARMRTQYGTGFDDHDPALCEALLASALGNEPIRTNAEPGANTAAQLALLRALTDGNGEEEMAGLLNQARMQANQLLEQHEARPLPSAPSSSNDVTASRNQ